MSNITISLDDKLIKEAKKIAIDRDTSFSGLIRDYLLELVNREQRRRQLEIKELDSLFESSQAVVGRKNWSREDLHERNGK